MYWAGEKNLYVVERMLQANRQVEAEVVSNNETKFTKSYTGSSKITGAKLSEACSVRANRQFPSPGPTGNFYQSGTKYF